VCCVHRYERTVAHRRKLNEFTTALSGTTGKLLPLYKSILQPGDLGEKYECHYHKPKEFVPKLLPKYFYMVCQQRWRFAKKFNLPEGMKDFELQPEAETETVEPHPHCDGGGCGSGGCGSGGCDGCELPTQTNGSSEGRGEESMHEAITRERERVGAQPPSWFDEDGSGYDEATGVYTLSEEDVRIVLAELQHWSVSWDARSRNKLCFTSTTLSPKMPSLGDGHNSVWQVRVPTSSTPPLQIFVHVWGVPSWALPVSERRHRAPGTNERKFDARKGGTKVCGVGLSRSPPSTATCSPR
jgi:hypothetical protein